ncbi:N-acetylglucosamine-6-phosphate deacetylase isoform X2 [Lampetra planeri]
MAMPSHQAVRDAPITQFINCLLLKDHKLIRDDLWVRSGRILDPEKLFFDEKVHADRRVDCHGLILAPGFIDVQLNGGYGVDFSSGGSGLQEGLSLVAQKLLTQGVTSFCPTLITSPPQLYHEVLPRLPRTEGGPHGAGTLGVHLEGPFISLEKKGAHPELLLRSFERRGMQDVLDTYGDLANVALVTLAPEMPRSGEVTRELTRRGVRVSLGHSTANLCQAEAVVEEGACFITHLFNAMVPFHHRDPGIVGLLTSDRVPPGRSVFYGMIADGIHTNPAALRIAHRAHPAGLVLVTDAIMAMGLPEGRHHLGQQTIEIEGLHAYVAGTKTLSGSIATMDMCVRHLRQASGCSVECALEAASLHPAQMLGISDRKGTLDYGTDADFVLISQSLEVCATYIRGERVWAARAPGASNNA